MGDRAFMFIGSLVLAIAFGVVMARKGWLWDGERAAGSGGRGARIRDLTGVEPLVLLVAGLLVLLASMVGASAMASLGEARLGAPDSARRSALTQAGAYPLAIGVGLFVVWLIGRRARSRERAGLRFRWSDVPRAGLALVLIAPFYLLVSEVAQAVFRAMNGAAPSPIQHEALKTLSAGHADGWAWGMVAGAVIGAPIVEELTFRVFVQGSVLRFVTAVGGTGDGGSAPGWTAWIAAVLTSGVWTATHVSSVPPIALPGLFVLGLGFGMAYERTQRLGVPIVMHMIFNAMNIVAVFAGLAG